MSLAQDTQAQQQLDADSREIDWLRVTPFILMHVACLGAFFTGVSSFALVVAIVLYIVRMFAITAFYHRYFSHRSFKTSRAVQFIFAVIGASSTQRGPIWWASHHRDHHRRTDVEHLDPHSPKDGFWWSHMGWFMSKKHYVANTKNVRDLLKYPELRWLDKYDFLMPVILATGLFCLGAALERFVPQLKTSGWQLLVWGYFISTIVLIHVTLCINSLAHTAGSVRYETKDDSKNNFILALLTLGEGWHNNHHYYPVSTRQGFYWWEIDVSYYLLKLMSYLGLVWGLKPVPIQIRESKQIKR